MSQNDIVVTVRFVLPPGKNETTCSEDLSCTYDQASDVGLNPSWIDHDDVLDLVLCKTDVFVMDPFEGKAFDLIASSKATLVGPRCLMSCLQKKEPVPELPYPMFTASMKGLVVTSTGLDAEKKDEIKKLVEKMAGIYSNAFHDGVTHLVASVVRSAKYNVAVEKEIPIMTTDWVSQVWIKSRSENVDAIDPQFTRYACPALLGLTICVSQMSNKDKDLLKKSIASHGGSYSKSLDMQSTSVLIIPTPEGEKFTYAKKWKVPTLHPNWIFDSIEKGYCLRTGTYEIQKNSCSTPTKEDVSKLQEVSMCSTIMAPNPNETGTVRVNETAVDPKNSTLLEGSKSDSWIKSLDMNRVTKAGPFLKDLKIFLSGFSEPHTEYLSKVISCAGGSRMIQLTSSVTHMVVKSFAKPKQLKELDLNPHQTSIQWLVESMRLGRPAPESDFPPLNPKSSFIAPAPPLAKEQITQFDNDLLSQYGAGVSSDTTLKENTALNQDETEEPCRFLSGKTVALYGFDNKTEIELTTAVEEEGGEIPSATDNITRVDYLILPVSGYKTVMVTAKETVNSIWFTECYETGELLEIEYYDRPLSIDLDLKPMKGVVIGVSGFSSRERQFICGVAQALGIVAQETFAKKDKVGSKKSTHLVCLSPEGNKYDAAIRWNLPVVSKDWILTCVSQMTWVSEKPFLMGDSKIFTEGKPIHQLNPPIKVLENTPELGPRKSIMSTVETPGLDMEKIRPKKIDLSPSIAEEWVRPPDSQPSPRPASRKRKLSNHEEEQNNDGLPSFIAKMDTPLKPYGAFLGSSDPSPRTRKVWKYHCDRVLANRNADEESRMNKREQYIQNCRAERTEEERIKVEKAKEREKNIVHKMKNDHEKFLNDLEAKGVPVLERSTRSFDDLMEEKLQKVGKSWKNPSKRAKLTSLEPLKEKTLPFTGIVVYITNKLKNSFDNLSSIVESMGGKITSTYSDEIVTHVLFSGRANDITKEFRTARNDGKIIVSPVWVYMSNEEGKKLDESAFPHTYNPKMSLSMSLSQSSSNIKATPKPKRLARVPSESTVIAEEDLEEISMDIAAMDKIINDNEPQSSEATKVMRMSLTSTEATPGRSSFGSKVNDEVLSSQNPESQVQWIDPQEDIEQKKLLEKLDRVPSSSTAEFESLNIENLTEELMGEKENTKVHSANYNFMVSTYSDSEKAKFGKFIQSLNDPNITFSNLPSCDPKSTHILTSKLNRSEKILSSLAMGKIFLHGSYFDACLETKSLPQPWEKYEWGNEANPFLAQLPEDSFEAKMARATYRWRINRESGGKSPFEGIVAIIHTSTLRRGAFQRLLEFGGATVISPQPPYREPQNATHCFAEPKKVAESPIDYQSLASNGIVVVQPLYINEFLVQDPVPPIEDYFLEPFKPFWKKY